jgi:O-antigen/teichoic acid export membrane protein
MLKRVMTGVGVNIFDKLSIATAQLLMVPLLAHAWGLKLYGLWVMLSTVPTFLAMGDLGFATAAGTRMTIANARGDRDRVILIFQSAWAAILLSSLVFTLLALAGAFLTPASVFGADLPLALPQLRLTLLVLLLYGILAVQGSIFYAGFRCAGLFALGNFLHSVMVILEAVFTFAAILGFAGTPLMVACCLFLSRAIGVTAQFTLMRRHVPWLPVSLARASLTEIRKLMAPAGTVMLLPISQACMLQGTALLLGLTAGEAAVPAFTAARTLSRVGQQMCWTVNAALMPEVSAAIGRRDLGAIAMMVFSTLAVSVVLIAPFALVFGVAGKSIILLWSRASSMPLR